ncbi:unnamed protein product, partial [Rotaria sp. Silwood1]
DLFGSITNVRSSLVILPIFVALTRYK